MVLSATLVNQFTQESITRIHDEDVQEDVSLAEGFIQRSTSRGLYYTLYNARKIGNPTLDVSVDSNLTPKQLSFRDSFINAGYVVEIDDKSGYWKLSWGTLGVETSVKVYSVRTTITPGAVEAATNDLILSTVSGVTPTGYPTSMLVSANGGDFDETTIGLTSQIWYEYIVRIHQQDEQDYSSMILTSLIGSGMGYTSSNTVVLRLA